MFKMSRFHSVNELIDMDLINISCFYDFVSVLQIYSTFGLFENCNMNSRKIHKILKFNKNKLKLGCVISCGLMKTKRQYTRESAGKQAQQQNIFISTAES